MLKRFQTTRQHYVNQELLDVQAGFRKGRGTKDQIANICWIMGFPGGSEVKASACNVGDLGLIPGSGRHLEKKMATHSSILAWRIPWTEEPGGLQSTGSQRVRHDWASDLTWESKRIPEKHLLLLYWLCQSFCLCGSQETVENSERDGNTRPPDLPLEKSVCRSGSNS